ncbi:hypothetical protein ATANTOWER_020645 [Ataeniobius toweri]|uniref:Transposase n=1 Tax=Ataeniobius toweri TaxID=208326 RepID=A0ABU7BIE7_9TELE|nr:hypothetical protein [Ataeniobius toweri]
MGFLQRPALLPVTFPEPPQLDVVPSCKWLLSVYSQDILAKLEDIKAHITSTYGSILKMDSTKKITKKLAGTAKRTALWLTSVGNEHGQILISVLTAQEGAGLDRMASDLVKRYEKAGVDPPVALYVDCGCCAEAAETTKLQARFSGWPQLLVRLDIWHFMRRLALGCTTDAHQLYPLYMSCMSACIFEWDAGDLALLREAKAQQLQAQGLSSADVDRHLTREELALHCRRRTRGVTTTVKLLEELFDVLMGCARGSTSLESFHLHLNRFIPGSSANSLNFQVYLLEGLHWWNQDRRVAALATEKSPLCCYTGDLLPSVNNNYEKLFGRKLAPEFCPPARCTGELIGLQYLFRQTGQALQDMNPDSEETARLVEEHDAVVDEEDEGFSELSADPKVLDMEVSPGSSSTVAPSTSSMLSPGSSSTVAPGSSSTVAPSSSSTVAPSTSSMLSEAGDTSNETMAVDDQNMPGYQHVDRLAEYLVGLREQTSLCLTNLQADCITELWQRLDDRDKQRVVYAARHQDRLLTLKRKGKGAESRWSLILRDYRKIRDLVVGNARVMQGKEIQLVEVNQNTLIQWHNVRQKNEELSVLLQGTAVPPNLPVSEEPLMDARVLPSVPVPAQYEHQYQLSECTAGQAKQRQAPCAILPKGATKRQSPLLVAPAVFPAPAARAPSAPGIPHQALTKAGQPVVLYQTVPPAEIQGTHQQPPTKRPYKRTVQANTCKKCGLFQTAETGHSHY